MTPPSNPRPGPLALAVGLLGLALLAPTASAGGRFHKKGQLVALPTTAPAAAPVQVLTAVPLQSAQLGVVQVQQAPVQWSVIPQAAVVPLQAQAAPSPAPTIHITVVEAPAAQAVPTAQAQAPQAQATLGAAPVQVIAAAAPVATQAVAVPQAVPVQLFYIPPIHKCSIFCKH